MNGTIQLDELCRIRYQRPLTACSDKEIYELLANEACRMSESVREEKRHHEDGKKLYYLCAEFLTGRLLSDRLIALGIYEQIREQLYAAGRSLAWIEVQEEEPSLGNGGLGRLAACFLDSLTHLGLSGDGVGLLYRYGLFRQHFEQLQQTERADPWLPCARLLRPTDFSCSVTCMGYHLQARMMDLDLLSPQGTVNTLHLFEPQSVARAQEVPTGPDFDMENIPEHLTWFLYPDDRTTAGKRLRLCQEYFLACCAAELILKEHEDRAGGDVKALAEAAVIQINDTHPAWIIPVLIQRLCERGVNVDDAIEQVQRCCAYTNHTVMSEALERWHISDIEAVAPELLPLLRRLDHIAGARARACGVEEEAVALICRGELSMARLAVHFSAHVNGVAALHTALLKTKVLPDLYRIYPDHFSNKTNGVSHRRWLIACNKPLTHWLYGRIGNGFVRDASQLSCLEAYVHDDAAKSELLQIKEKNKSRLREYLMRTRGIVLMENGVFDVQIKRLHEYKRQHLNALYLIDRLLSLREGEVLPVPLVAIFGAKAAPSYQMAKDIIHLILCLEKICREDTACQGQLQIVFVENYDVSTAEYLIPAAEISEQISLASKEASGTGNMKMMMNGALTLGTADGANIEILQRVGEENMYLFGMSGEQVSALEGSGGYSPRNYYEKDERLKRAVDFIICDDMLRLGNEERLRRLHGTLLGEDRYMSFADFASYRDCRDRALLDYRDRERWAEKMMINISRSGYFAADRTVAEYDRDIWHLAGQQENGSREWEKWNEREQ